MLENQKLITSYHEAGHALGTIFSDSELEIKEIVLDHPNRKVNGAIRHKKFKGKHTLKNTFGYVVMLYGGVVAEEKMLGRSSGLEEGDLQTARDIAQEIVCFDIKDDEFEKLCDEADKTLIGLFDQSNFPTSIRQLSHSIDRLALRSKRLRMAITKHAACSSDGDLMSPGSVV